MGFCDSEYRQKMPAIRAEKRYRSQGQKLGSTLADLTDELTRQSQVHCTSAYKDDLSDISSAFKYPNRSEIFALSQNYI
jgi:hypothetical protein